MINRKKKVRSTASAGRDNGGDDDNASSCSDTSDVVVVGCTGGGGGRRTGSRRGGTSSNSLWTKSPIQARPDSGYAEWDNTSTQSNFHNIRHHQSKSAKARLWNKLQHDSIQREALSSSIPTITEEC